MKNIAPILVCILAFALALGVASVLGQLILLVQEPERAPLRLHNAIQALERRVSCLETGCIEAETDLPGDYR